MSLRLALILTGIVVLLMCLACGGLIAILAQPDAVNREQRSSQFGGGLGTLTAILLAAIWIPYAVTLKKKRDEANKPTKRKKKKPRPQDDDE